MSNLQLLYPEILLSILALIMMLADLWIPSKHGKGLFHMGIACSVLTLGMIGMSYTDPKTFQGIGTMWMVDPLSQFFKCIVLIATILALVLTIDYASASVSKRHLGTFTALILLSSMGMMLLVSATDLLLLFLSLELISITSFILAGFEYKDLKSSEGAIKYFLFGSFSSAIMVYGISLYYGAAGTTNLMSISPASISPMLILSVFLILVGFGFKASVVPFHLWVPDAYEGAPTPVTAYLSVAPKLAALAAMLRVFTSLLSPMDLRLLFAYFAVLTMTVGNLTAIFQNNVKRLLAYSSIAQAGYMLIGFAAGTMGREAVLLYALVYVFMNIGVFTVAIMVGNDDSYELEAFSGLATRNLGAALLMAFFLLSLAGIPPMAGFIAKFYIFSAAVNAQWYWLAVIGVLNSVISAFYYLRIAYYMFFMPAGDRAPLRSGFYLYSGLTVAAIGIFLIGLYPDPFIKMVRASSRTLRDRPASVALSRLVP